MTSLSRREAGQALAPRIAPHVEPGAQGGQGAQVFALRPAAVPVAYEIAHQLRLALDLLPTRNVAALGALEMPIGATAAGGGRAEDWSASDQRGLTRAQVRQLFAMEENQLGEDSIRLRGGVALPEIEGRVVVLVDDGITTGLRMCAAIAAVRARRPERIIVAAPGCPDDAADRLRGNADELIRLVAVSRPEYGDAPMAAEEAVGLVARARSELAADTVDLYLG